jgi:tRNA(Arg) A34 adenosine deaminase TadA
VRPETGRPAVKAALEADQPARGERDQQVLEDCEFYVSHLPCSVRSLMKKRNAADA